MSRKAQSKADNVKWAPEGEMNEEFLEGLLEKTRQISRALQNRREGEMLDYAMLVKWLSEFLETDAYIISRDGKVLGHAWVSDYGSEVLLDGEEEEYLPRKFLEKVNRFRESEIDDEDIYLLDKNAGSESHLMCVPLFFEVATNRLGTLVLTRSEQSFTLKDMFLAEYAGTLVSMEMMGDRSKNIEERSRDKISVQKAMRALSYSEMESMKHIMAELGGEEGVAIASKVADRVGVTRSVIVNALRKLESAGLIESRSLGMKGTYIKVLIPLFVEELGSATSARVTY
ncbi:MAG: GTP-sensing pleiotropic transcriptional regulator CodY [Synergistaceae bacterium]|jgi:transcriptional pleiotropic repressor|nr:GTP-sensing pleiotropic transcriptional regulator CodY [Synergistaceae bacterium]